MLATELTEEERDYFEACFYSIEDFNEESKALFEWSQPWNFHKRKLYGKTIKEMAKNYFDEFREEIEDDLKEEKSRCRYCGGSGCNECLMLNN